RKHSRADGDTVCCPRFIRRGGPRQIWCPPSANLVGPEVRSYGTPSSASEGQQFGGNDQEKSRQEFLYSLQPFQRPILRKAAQSKQGGAVVPPITGRFARKTEGVELHASGAEILQFSHFSLDCL